MSSRVTQDRPVTGIALMIAFCAVIPFSDALAKLLGDRFPLLQLIEARFIAQSALFLPVALWLSGPIFPSRRAFWLTGLRTVLQIIGLAAMFTSLRFLPLADAIAIVFVMPFITLLLGHFFLGEEVGFRRIGSCVVGFIGTLMILQPSFAAVGWPALLPFVVAAVFSIFTLLTRLLSDEMSPIAMQAGAGIIALPLLLPLGLLHVPGDPPPLDWIMPEGWDLWLLVALGVTGAVGHLLITASLRYAPSATIAPLHYLEIPFATLLGWLIFQDLPGGLAAWGIALTMAAGLYIIIRERAASSSPSGAGGHRKPDVSG